MQRVTGHAMIEQLMDNVYRPAADLNTRMVNGCQFVDSGNIIIPDDRNIARYLQTHPGQLVDSI